MAMVMPTMEAKALLMMALKRRTVMTGRVCVCRRRSEDGDDHDRDSSGDDQWL